MIAVKITRVEAIPFAIPYVKPLKFASGEVHTAEHVLVRVPQLATDVHGVKTLEHLAAFLATERVST